MANIPHFVNRVEIQFHFNFQKIYLKMFCDPLTPLFSLPESKDLKSVWWLVAPRVSQDDAILSRDKGQRKPLIFTNF